MENIDVQEKKKIIILHCLRCDSRWVQRNPLHEPIACAVCNTRYWNLPRQDRKETKHAKQRAGSSIITT